MSDGAGASCQITLATWCSGSDLGGPYPRRFRSPTHISKYDGETNPDHWLEDYCLVMKVGGSDDDFII
jgi:hypothetical protein